MREHLSTVGLDEKRAAVASVQRLLPRRESADTGADAGKPANDTAEAEATTAASRHELRRRGAGIVTPIREPCQGSRYNQPS
jgi:hypothetical protein